MNRKLPPANWFAAFPVELPTSLLNWMKELASSDLHFLKLFKPCDLHLTLAFFGPLDEKKVQLALDEIEKLTMRSVPCTFGTLRLLPKPKRFSAISLEIEQGHDDLADAMRKWGPGLLHLLGLPRDTRPPLPHVTIARPKGKTRDTIERILDWCSHLNVPNDEFYLSSPKLYTRSTQREKSLFQIVTKRSKTFEKEE